MGRGSPTLGRNGDCLLGRGVSYDREIQVVFREGELYAGIVGMSITFSDGEKMD